MKRLLSAAAAVALLALPARAGDDLPRELYRAAAIPAGLAQGPYAVVRYDATRFEVKDVRTARMSTRRIVTILNAEGRSFARIVVPYSARTKISSLEGRLYDADGKEVRSLGGDDIGDYSAVSDYALYDESRVRTAELHASAFPYTVEFDYAIDYNGYLNWPEWEPESEHAAVERSSYEVTLPKGMELRTWSNFGAIPKITEEGGNKTAYWEVDLLPEFTPVKWGPAEEDQGRRLLAAPSAFELEGRRGDLSSWRTFGLWYGSLREGRQALVPADTAEAVRISASSGDPRERARALYAYMQSKTRYVSVDLGIGGWQPFDASTVAEHGYGDCKALSNYMLALLKAAQITAYPALIESGVPAARFDPSFPCNRFNHEILCLPFGSDTTWLECTSQSAPFGHLSSSTENRYALLITPDGGKLVRTPVSTPAGNARIRRCAVKLAAGGDAFVAVRMSYAGDAQDPVREELLDATPKERDEWLHDNAGFPAYKIREADFSGIAAGKTTLTLGFGAELPRYASPAGDRLLFPPRLPDGPPVRFLVAGTRTQPIVRAYPSLNIDSISYELPPGFAADALPKPVEITTDFGKFTAASSAARDGSVVYVRRFEISAVEIPATRYDEYRKFLEAVAQSDKALASLVRK